MKAKKPARMPLKETTNPKTAPVGPPVPCEDCEQPIPAARLQLVQTKLCVECQEAYEKELTERGEAGKVRHRMAFEVVGDEEVEEVNLHLVRAR